LPTALHPKHPPLLVVDAQEALVGLAQMNVIQLHTWNAVQPDLEHPDRFVLDLDPDPSLSWRTMTEAAELAKVLLDEVGLKSFIKTTGGKGYHIVIPLTRRQRWDEVKAFSQGIARAYGESAARPILGSAGSQEPCWKDLHRLSA
jgi:bifunctional non-homologous end joining protein LigD